MLAVTDMNYNEIGVQMPPHSHANMYPLLYNALVHRLYTRECVRQGRVLIWYAS